MLFPPSSQPMAAHTRRTTNGEGRDFMTVDDFNRMVDSKRGNASGWPACLTYKLHGNQATITMFTGFRKKDFRRFDSWGMAFVAEAEREVGLRVSTVAFNLLRENVTAGKADFEAFRRRVSFLNINNTDNDGNNIAFEIVRNNEPVPLDDKQTLFNRPGSERIRPLADIKERHDNTPGRLEKDFQTFLFGSDRKKNDNIKKITNERLAILGEDFFNLKRKQFRLLREFPTGVFDERIAERNRILPTEYVDIVTLNKHGELSVIELKLNESQLEVISQILDYALFFGCYLKTLIPEIRAQFGSVAIEERVVCYVVNNHFHDKFKDIMKYYRTREKSFNFRLKRVLLGQTESM
jgi:hypothetical protein